jgi:hypothetical protein
MPAGCTRSSLEESMKKYLPFAMLFICASAVEAQEPVVDEPVAQTRAETASVTPTPAEGAAVTDRTARPVIDLKTRSATASAVEAATMRAPAPDVDLVQDVNPPPNFWWLVGGIVLAGVILALLL